jgi:hypothetical protein
MQAPWGARPHGSRVDRPVGCWHPQRLGHDSVDGDAIEWSRIARSGQFGPSIVTAANLAEAGLCDRDSITVASARSTLAIRGSEMLDAKVGGVDPPWLSPARSSRAGFFDLGLLDLLARVRRSHDQTSHDSL